MNKSVSTCVMTRLLMERFQSGNGDFSCNLTAHTTCCLFRIGALRDKIYAFPRQVNVVNLIFYERPCIYLQGTQRKDTHECYLQQDMRCDLISLFGGQLYVFCVIYILNIIFFFTEVKKILIILWRRKFLQITNRTEKCYKDIHFFSNHFCDLYNTWNEKQLLFYDWEMLSCNSEYEKAILFNSLFFAILIVMLETGLTSKNRWENAAVRKLITSRYLRRY